MRAANQRIRLAIVSPFLDKKNGTERIVIEWISLLPDRFEIHVYSQRVEDMDVSRIIWHRVPKLPGPHLLNFIWWFAANRLWRAWDHFFRGLAYDLVFAPGVNCFDADVVSVHIVFAEFLRQAQPEMKFSRNPVHSWLRLAHRKLYYHLIILLEKRVYSSSETELILTARKTADDLGRFYGRNEAMPILYVGIDHGVFNPSTMALLRDKARKQLGLADDEFAVLLIGNDLLKKGLAVLIESFFELNELPARLIVVTRESGSGTKIRDLGSRAQLLPPRKDVEFYYAASDAYAGPSLEDTFAMPPGEAMACGLPVIVSATAGISEIVTHGVDGLILDDPRNSSELAAMIRRLFEDKEFRTRLGENAVTTAQQFTWESNARDLTAIFDEIIRRKNLLPSQTLPQKTGNRADEFGK